MADNVEECDSNLVRHAEYELRRDPPVPQKVAANRDAKVMPPSRRPIFSYSQLKLYESCPKAWEFSYIKKIKGNRRIFLEGSVVHKLNKDLFLDPARSVEKVLEKAPGIFWAEAKALEIDWKDENADDVYLDAISSFKCLVAFQKYLKILENPNAHSEWKFYIPYTTLTGVDYAILGFIDMVYKDEENSSTVILDFKNSSDYKYFDKRQLILYALAWQRMTGDVPSKIGFFLVKSKKLVWYPFTEEEYSDLLNKFDWTVSEIEQKKKMGSSFEAKPGWQCRFCQFKTMCEFSSTKNKEEKQ